MKRNGALISRVAVCLAAAALIVFGIALGVGHSYDVFARILIAAEVSLVGLIMLVVVIARAVDA